VIEEEEGDDYRQVRSPVGTSLDDRIRDAEEKIKRSNNRRPRTAGHDSTPPISGATRRHDSYSRTSHSPSTNTTSTLRRSATLSSASAMTPNGGNASDSSTRRPGIVARLSGEDVHERENSGGSGSSGRRKPIPDFRAGGLVGRPIYPDDLIKADKLVHSSKISLDDHRFRIAQLPIVSSIVQGQRHTVL
jgi:hypothetical protein